MGSDGAPTGSARRRRDVGVTSQDIQIRTAKVVRQTRIVAAESRNSVPADASICHAESLFLDTYFSDSPTTYRHDFVMMLDAR